MLGSLPPPSSFGFRRRALLISIVCVALFTAGQAFATNPPYWNGGTPTWDGNAGNVVYKPVAWPASGSWNAYTSGNVPISDAQTSDPSNGGTSPQGYVNVSSGCPEGSQPSIYFAFDSVNNVMFFRWRLEKAPNNYATGPSPGSYSSTSPWNSGQWTVLFDLNGDGYRDFAVTLNGSSGSPAAPIDVLASVYSTTTTNSIDYVGDPAVHKLRLNPTAFIQGNAGSTTNQILQFNGSGVPSTVQWPNGTSETVWDYGTTRAINISTPTCEQYFVDYQIPLAMLDATALGGMALTPTTPFSFVYATANSLQNPFQKDVVYNGDYVCPPTAPAPFGDPLTLSGGIIKQPIVTSISAGAAASCAVPVTAQVLDSLLITNCNTVSTLLNAQFKYWFDVNGDGLPNDAGGSWVNIGTPTVPVGTTVTTNWSILNLIRGQYLLALELTDAQGNTTRSWSPAETPPFYTNVPTAGVNPATLGVNYTKVVVGSACGAAIPPATKTASLTEVQAGGSVSYTLSLTNNTSTTLTVSSITDTLPPGFTYQSTGGGSLSPSSSPTAGSSGTITWTFSTPASILPGATATLTFQVQAGSAAGSFFNSGTFVTNVGSISATTATGLSVKTTSLVATKSVALASNPTVPVAIVDRGSTVRFTITYENNSATDVTSVVITDPLPAGFTYVAASPPGPASAPTVGTNGTVVWNIGTVAANTGPFTVYVDAVATQSGLATNTATIASGNASTLNPSAQVTVSGPVLAITKTANTSYLVTTPTGTIDYTISYANIGNAAASLTTLTDTAGSGFTLVTGAPTTAGCTQPAGVGTLVTCTLGPTLLPSTTGSVTLRFSVDSSAPTSYKNTATINATNASPSSATAEFTIQTGSNTCTNSTYYFRNTSLDVGAAGTRRIANTTAPTSATATTEPRLAVGQTPVEFARFYSDPAFLTAQAIAGNVTVSFYVDKSGAPSSTFTVNLLSYNPTTGVTTTLGTGTTSVTGNRTNHLATVTITPTTTVVPEGYRLLWIVTGVTNHASQTNDLTLLFDSTTSPSASTVCLIPIVPSITKSADKMVVIPGDPLTYKLTVTNPSTVPLPGVLVTDPLFAGLTHTSSSSTVGTCSFTSPTVTCNVGTLAAGASATITINTTVNTSITGTSFTNTATLQNSYTSNKTSSVTTSIARPSLAITKSVNDATLAPGNNLTYTVKVTNTGTGPATSVVVSDPIPSGITYSTSATTAGSCSYTAPTLTCTIPTLAAGASATITINANVTLTGYAAGSTTVTNTASVVDAYNITAKTASVPITVTATPVISISESYTASATRVVYVDVTAGGSGYVSIPTVVFGAGCTTPPTAVASIDATGAVSGVTITSPGSGCSAVPTISFSGGGGTGAAATAFIGPAPGDTITFTITVNNTGTAAAAGVTAYDIVPAYTTWQSGGSFSLGTVSSSLGTIAVGGNASFSYTVIVDSSLPAGTTSLTTSATATSTNAAATGPTSVAPQTGAQPAYSISKSPTAAFGYPLTTLAANASASSTITVASSALLTTGSYVAIDNGSGYTVAFVTAIAGNSVTLDRTVTASFLAYVVPVVEFVISYSNDGNATGTSITISDALPTNLRYAGYPSGDPAPTTAPPLGTNGTVSWTIGSLPDGASGSRSFYAFAVSAGTYTNTGSIAENTLGENRNKSATSTVTFGALQPSKVTTTPSIVSPGVAHYTITITNPLPSTTATGVTVTDNLPAGFTYKTGTTVINPGGITTDPSGSTTPTWSGLTIAPSGTLTIDFDVNVANVSNGTYDNEILVTASVPSLAFDFLATTAEDVRVCVAAPPINAPSACASQPGNVASIPAQPGATVTWSITNGNGSITTQNTGTVDYVTVGNGGSGYLSGALITFSGGGGSGAAATASVSSGVITGIIVTKYGSGYTSAPTVVITPIGGGSGAIAVATLGDGVIYTAGASGTVDLRVDITEGACSVVATKQVPIIAPPVITSQPTSSTVCNTAAQSATFTAAQTNGTTTMWQVSADGGTSWSNTGVTGGTLTIAPASAYYVSGYLFRFAAYNGVCATYSNAALLTLSCSPDLQLTITDSPDPVSAGNDITYTATVTNIGPNDALSPSVVFNIPAGATMSTPVSVTGWTCTVPTLTGPATLTCTASGNLTPTASATLTVVLATSASLADGSSLSLTGTASLGAGTDANAANNVTSAATAVNRAVDAAITKGVSPSGPILPGPPNPSVTWTLNVTNNGPSVATVTVTDSLPAGFSYASHTTTRGTCSYTAPTLTCNVGTMNKNDAVTITITGTITVSTTIVTNTASVSVLETDTNPANNSSSSSITILAPTLVRELSYEAYEAGGAVSLVWATGYEVDNVGFNVYRDAVGGRTKMTESSMIAGSALLVGAGVELTAGYSYRWTDRNPVAGAVYWIEDVGMDGEGDLYGPIVPGVSAGEESLLASQLEAKPDDSPTFATLSANVPAGESRLVALDGLEYAAKATSGIPTSVKQRWQFDIAATDAVKILVGAEGYYRVTRADLAAAGFDPGPDASRLQLFSDAEEVPIAIVDGGDRSWDSSDYFEFFGAGLDAMYAGTRTYWLVNGNITGRNGLRFKVSGNGKTVPLGNSSFAYTLERRDRTVYFAALTSNGDADNFFGPIVTTTPVLQRFTISNLDPAMTGGTLEVSLQGVNFDVVHKVQVTLNGRPLGVVEFLGREAGRITVPVPDGLLRNGTNDVSLKSIAATSDISVIDTVRLTYRHLFVADQNALRFVVPSGSQVTVTGFSNPDIRVLDVTDPRLPMEVRTERIVDGNGLYAVSVSATEKGTRVFYAVTGDRSAKPVTISRNQPSRWNAKENAADLVVITHPALADAAQPLVARRTADGLRTLLVQVDDIYDEFGFGQKSAEALRKFLKWTTTEWTTSPRWVVLMGDASLDPRNYLGFGDRDLVPTRPVAMRSLKTASDDWLVDFDENGLPDMFIGRLSASTPAEAATIVSKTLDYAPRSPKAAFLVADRNDVFDFEAASAKVRTLLGDGFVSQELRIGRTTAPKASFIAGVNAGPTIVNFVGHGSVEVIGKSVFFRSSDVGSLTNRTALSFFVMMDCLNAQFHDVFTFSLGEALLRSAKGGAVAVWASSALTEPDQQSLMNQELARILAAEPSITLGEAVARAKSATTSSDVRRSWVLLGDPTLRLQN